MNGSRSGERSSGIVPWNVFAATVSMLLYLPLCHILTTVSRFADSLELAGTVPSTVAMHLLLSGIMVSPCLLLKKGGKWNG